MAETKRKGDLGEALVMADALQRGYKVAIPFGEDWRYDLIVLRKGQLERVQCKYTVSDGEKIEVQCQSGGRRLKAKYTTDEIDWLAVYDETTKRVYYIPSSALGEGRRMVTLRLTATKNGQVKNVRWAADFVDW